MLQSPYATFIGQWLTHHTYSYPKHVWSPSGGWYAQPANWRTNTAIMGSVVIGVAAMAWSVSADREHRTKMPEVRTCGAVMQMRKSLVSNSSHSPAASSHHDTGREKFANMRRRRGKLEKERSKGDVIYGVHGMPRGCGEGGTVYIQKVSTN